MEKLFERTDKRDRDQLLKFLVSGMNEDVRESHKQICCTLPIFQGFRAVRGVGDRGVQWVDDDDAEAIFENNVSPSFVSLAEIKEKHQEPRLCMGIAPKLLDDNFVFVNEGDSALVEF